MESIVTVLPTISASKIITYRTCGRQYKYKYIDKLPDQKNISALMGTALHKALELRDKDSAVKTFTSIMEGTLEEWESSRTVIKGIELFNKCLKIGREMLRAFDWNTFENTDATEVKFTLPFPNKENPLCNITGIIDRIDVEYDVLTKNDDLKWLVITDYKSSSILPNVKTLAHDPQFVIYYWAAAQIYGRVPDEMIWWHLRSNTLYQIDVKTDYERKLAQLTEDIENMLNSPSYERRMLDAVCRSKCAFYEQCYGNTSSNTREDDQE